MSTTRSTSTGRPLADHSQPYGIARYATYRVKEVASILACSADVVRSFFKDAEPGEVVKVHSQRLRPHRKNRTTILVPYARLIQLVQNDRRPL